MDSDRVKQEVIKELEVLSVEEMISRYTKNQLQSFFKYLYGIEPRSAYKKDDLAYKCWSFIADDKRTKDLCKILR